MARHLLLLLLLLSACKTETPVETARPVKAVRAIETSAIGNQVSFPGTLRAFQRADLSFRIDGTVISRDITMGQEVKQDEILIRLDPREYELAVDKAKGNVESTQAQLDFADRDYVRMKNIYEKDPGAISQSLLDRKKESFNKLKAELDIAHSELYKAIDNLSYTMLKAPFEGIVAAIYVENHEQVRAKQNAVRVIDATEREMEISVPEKYINELLTGQTLHFKVRLDAFPKYEFSATIKEIGTEASSTTQTYPVTLSLHDVPIEISLLAGMSGKAILPIATKQTKEFKLPKSAIFTDNLNNNFVWVVDPATQTVHKKPVKLVNNGNQDYATVLEGIKTGDWIVIAGTSFLSENQKVKLAEEQARP